MVFVYFEVESCQSNRLISGKKVNISSGVQMNVSLAYAVYKENKMVEVN